MAVTRKMTMRHKRVGNILESINRDIGESGALELIGEDGTFSVPMGLRRAIARTALVMIEAMDPEERKRRAELRKKGEHWKIGLSPSEIAKREEKVEKGRKRIAGQKKKRKAKRKAKKAAPKRKDGGDGGPPDDAAGAAQAVDGGPTDARKDADAAKGVKTAGDKVRDAYASKKTGRPLKGAAVFSKMDKRIRSGDLDIGKKGKPARGVKGKVAALRKAADAGREAIQKAKKGRKGGEQRQAPPGMPRGGRWDMPQPKRGTIPSEFRGHQKKKQSDLAALEKARQQRSGGVKGHRPPFIGPMRVGELPPRKGHKARGLRSKAGHLARLRYMDPELRDKKHDVAKGYDPEDKLAKIRDRHPRLDTDQATSRRDRHMGRLKKHPTKKGYHLDADGREVHGSGKSDNKKFANATTFGNSDTDALLHTDKSKEGARGSADDDEFVFKGDTKKDPRNKWYRVSKEGGYAAAMASLGKAYHKSGKFRSKVVAKVKSTGFTDGQGHQIDVKPTGSLHNERGACFGKKSGQLTKVGKAMKKNNPSEFYRLCKGSHDGEGGTKKGRSEYTRGFDPRHDDPTKQHKLHKAAEAGKAEEPHANIARHAAARPLRRSAIQSKIGRISNAARRQD